MSSARRAQAAAEGGGARRAWLVFGLALALGTCTEPPARGSPREGPNVVLIVVDTLRADHLGPYGYARDTSAGLGAFLEHATVFERCYAPTSWTAPSTASILTGLHPLRHGVVDPGSALPERVTTTAEALSTTARWASLGLSFNHNVSATTRFDQGFEAFEAFDGGSTAYPDAAGMIDRAIGWLDDVDDRFLLYLQPMNVHGPYRVPEARRAHLLGTAPSGGFTYYGDTMRGIMKDGRVEWRDAVSDALLTSLAEQYDTAVRYTLDEVGRLLDALRRRGLYDRSLIVLTSDHGEELFDHGGFSHGYSLHEEVLHVPLLVKWPGDREGARVSTPVSLLDLHPTVLEAAGVAVPAGLDGRSLRAVATEGGRARVEFVAGADTDARELLFQVRWPKRCVAEALRRGRWKLIRVRHDYASADERVLLYDVAADPRERVDRAREEPALVAELLARLDARLAEAGREASPDAENVLDRMDEETLRALGYL